MLSLLLLFFVWIPLGMYALAVVIFFLQLIEKMFEKD